jgi:hypothetical protein
MGLEGKKVWVDLEHQKGGIMLNSLFKRLEANGCELIYTARDFGNNIQVLDELGIPYILVGKHGGETLEGKLYASLQRCLDLIPIVKEFQPDHYVSFGSVEGTRVAFGLRIPSIFFNDEPRSAAVARLTLAIIDHVITPACIPADEYIKLGATPEKIVQYNGIDEIAWIAPYEPNPAVLDELDLQKGEYVLMRTEMTHAEYLRDKMRPEQTYIVDFFPQIYREFPNHKYFLLARTDLQYDWMVEQFKDYDQDHVIVTKFVPRLQDFIFYSALITSGGGTIVRESALMDVPSLEFFPGETAWQEHFLADNGFPLYHIREPDAIAEKAIEILGTLPGPGRFTEAYKERLADYENPNDVCYKYITERLLGLDSE